MCGIVGVVGKADETFLDQSLEKMKHRGPDDRGIWIEKEQRAGLGQVRLSIIDLSPLGHQPMTTPDQKLWIVFNGEIYNYRELRSDLEKKGVCFVSHSDTEVLLHLYRDQGPEMLQKLNGIFSFALWDETKKELFAARDGLGVKPFYYCQRNRSFYFASELKAFKAIPGVSFEINPTAFHYYLAYLWCPAPATPWKDVFKLEPGHALRVKNGEILQKWKYYDLPYGLPLLKNSENEIAEMTAQKLEKAVERQMVADVPVGAFLSGGLDSSALVYFARKFSSSNMDCFTIGFENSSGRFDGFIEDLLYARKAARALDVNLHVVTVGTGMADRLGEMIYHLDEPQADFAPLNVLFISELARQHGIKVVLSGAGGDDLFSGYRRHTALLAEKYWAWLPWSVRSWTKNFMETKIDQSSALGRRLVRAFRFADRDYKERLAGYFLWMEESLLYSLYSENTRNFLKDKPVMAPLLSSLSQLPESTPLLNQMLYLESKHFLADHNLPYTDKMGMAASVEIRVPFLDPELIDLAVRIPPSLKHKRNISKYILKKAMTPYLPADIIHRPKSGFGVPLRQWLHGGMKDVMMDLLSPTNLSQRGLFDPVQVEQLIRDDEAGKVDGAYPLLSMMCMEWWMRLFA